MRLASTRRGFFRDRRRTDEGRRAPSLSDEQQGRRDMRNYITDEVKALIGLESEWEESCDPVERGQIRRHAQAIMDPDPAYWDDEYAKSTVAGEVTAPPLFPLHALRVRPDVPDPFERAATDPDFDGSVRGVMKGLVPLPIPLTRVLNG